MNELKDKIALITGAGSGIGQASAILFAKEGATVICSNRNKEKGLATIQYINDKGGKAEFIQTDISKHDEIKGLIEEIITKYGRLDCAFNNAGIDGIKNTITECSEEEWDEIMDTNLKGTYLLMKHEILHMLDRKMGSIVNMSSVCGIIARPGRCAYNASRHGVIALTKTAALEYSNQGIRINAVGPGSIKTDIFSRSTKGNPQLEQAYAAAHPIGRIGEPHEVAEAALWLCSDRSSFVTGHTLLVDGGFTIQ